MLARKLAEAIARTLRDAEADGDSGARLIERLASVMAVQMRLEGVDTPHLDRVIIDAHVRARRRDPR